MVVPQKNIIVFDCFAGTFSVSKAIPFLNFRVVHAFAIELDPRLCENAPRAEDLGLLPENFEVIQGDFSSIAVQAKLRTSLTRLLENTHLPIHGILVFAGVPCTYYSSFQQASQMRTHEKNPKHIETNQMASDRLVLSVLSFFDHVKILSEHVNTKSSLVIENPWSSLFLNIKYPGDPTISRGLQARYALALRNRPFLQPFLAKNGGPLHVVKYNWCAFDETCFAFWLLLFSF
jgi:hypothetical protein